MIRGLTIEPGDVTRYELQWLELPEGTSILDHKNKTYLVRFNAGDFKDVSIQYKGFVPIEVNSSMTVETLRDRFDISVFETARVLTTLLFRMFGIKTVWASELIKVITDKFKGVDEKIIELVKENDLEMEGIDDGQEQVESNENDGDSKATPVNSDNES